MSSQATNIAASLNDLLERHDADFVDCAYQTLLRRPPDPEGFYACQEQLRHGQSKLSILKQLRFSPEGNQEHPLAAALDTAIQALISEPDRLMHASTSTKGIYFQFKTAAARYARKVI